MKTRTLLFLSALLFQFLVASARDYSYDEYVTFETAKRIVEEGRGDIEPTPEVMQYARPSPTGLWYSKLGMGMVGFLIPFYIAGRMAGMLLGAVRPEVFGFLLAMVANAFVIPGILVYFHSTLRRFGARRGDAVVVTLLLGFGTTLVVYGRGLFNDALVALYLLLAFRNFHYGRPILAGLAFAVVAATRLEYAVAAAAFIAAWRSHRARLSFALPLLTVMAVLFLYNFARFGFPLDQGQLDPESGDTFSTPLALGLAGILLSPGKGFIWYCPPAILGIAGIRAFYRRFSRETWLLAGTIIPVLVLQALWHSWMGGWSYGPRRMVALLPLLMIPALGVIERLRCSKNGRAAIILAGASGFAMQLGGLAVDFMDYIRSAPSFHDTLWTFRHSGAFGQLAYLARSGEWDLWYVRMTGGEWTGLAAGIVSVLGAAWLAVTGLLLRKI